MAQRKYGDPGNPTAAFEAMRPAYAAAVLLKQQVKPLGPDYLVLEALTKAMSTAAYHFLRDPYFFGSEPHSS